MERERRNNGGFVDHHPLLMESSSKPFPVSSSSSACSPAAAAAATYIEHQVSKFDTLAGVAIKYGVEVADVKRMNGLVTDLQMFALKTLHIPLPGRHPPSPVVTNGVDSQGPSNSEQTPPNRRHSDIFDSFQSLRLKPSSQRRVSSAMSTLQGYYGLKPPDHKPVPEGFEMSVYRKGGAHYLEDASLSSAQTPSLSNPLTHHRKSRSVADRLWMENGNLSKALLAAEGREAESDKWFEKLLRRNHKSEADFTSPAPEKLLKDESNNGGFSSIAGSGLALRPKAASRTVSAAADSDTGRPNPSPVGLGDSFVADSSSVVRKSSSTSNLQDSDNNSTSLSIWPTSKWSLKPDLQALSTAAITRPIFDGLPKPITGRRNKTAVD